MGSPQWPGGARATHRASSAALHWLRIEEDDEDESDEDEEEDEDDVEEYTDEFCELEELAEELEGELERS